MRTSYIEKHIQDLSKSSDFTYDSQNQELLFFDSDLSLKSLRVEENSEGQVINWKEGNLKVLHSGLKDCAQLCSKRKNPMKNLQNSDDSTQSLMIQQSSNNLQNRSDLDQLQPALQDNERDKIGVEDKYNNLNISSARLIPYNPQEANPIPNQQNKLLFSTSGLTVTCMDSSPQVAISTIGFSEGEHFWEFYCPIYCQKIEMGIVAPSLKQFHMIDFNTTTPRQVTFRLNFNTYKLSVYLNGNLHNQKSQILTTLKSSSDKGTTSSATSSEKTLWFPALRMKEVGISVIFNPFSHDIENPLGIYAQQEIGRGIGGEGKGGILEENIKQELQSRVISLNQIIKDKLELQRKQHQEIETVQSQKKEQNYSTSNFIYQVNSNMKNNNLLIVEQDKIKLIKKDESGQFPINCSIFQNKPQHPEDYIDLTLDVNDTIFLLENVDWISLIEDNYLGLKDVHSLMELIKISVSEVSLLNKYIQLHLQFKLAKKCVDSIGSFSLQQYKIIFNTLHTEKLDQILFNFPPPPPSTNFINQSSSTNIVSENPQTMLKISQTYDSIFEQIKIVLCLDEQLFGMTLHHEASAQLVSMFTTKLSKPYSSFSRLGTLLNYTKSQYSPLELAEAGLFNYYDTLSSLRHFEFPQIKIDALETMKKKIPLWQNISLQIPHSRMHKGLTCLNIPLYQTINNIPYQQHLCMVEKIIGEVKDTQKIYSAKSIEPIRILRPNRQYTSNYVSTVSSNGCVNVWNTEVALIRVFVSDFKRDFVAPKSLKGLLSTNDLKANLKNVESGLFYDLKFPAKTQRKTREQKQQDKKLQENYQKKQITAQEITDQLLSLGYNNEIAQKVTLNIKKYTLEEAISEAGRLQILENQGEDAYDSQLSSQKDDEALSLENEFEWLCTECTFRNSEQKYQNKCEICTEPRKIKQDLGELNLVKNKSKENVLDNLSKLDSLINTIGKQSSKKQEENTMMAPSQELSVSTNQNKQQSQTEERYFIKPEWQCPPCGQLVLRSQEVCDKCGSHVPEEFKCTFTEYTTLKQAIEKKQKDENERKLAKRADDLKNFCLEENSKVQTGIMINCELNKLCPLIVGVGMNSTKKDSEVQSMLRIRRFGFEPNYLNNFYKLSNLTGQQTSTPQSGSNIQSSKTIVNQLDGSIITEKTMGSIENSLFRSENNRQVVECLEPLFMSNQRFSNDSTSHIEAIQRQQNISNEKKALFHQEWLELAQHDIVLNDERIIDCVTWCIDLDTSANQHDGLTKKMDMSISHHIYGDSVAGDYQSLMDNVDKTNQSLLSVSSPQMQASIKIPDDMNFIEKSQQIPLPSDENSLRKESFRVVLLTETMSQSLKVHIYRIEVDNINPYSSDSIQVTLLKEQKVSGPGYATEASRLFIPEHSQIAYLISGNQIVNIPLYQEAISGSSIESKALKDNPLCTRFLGKDRLVTLDSSDNLTLIQTSNKNLNNMVSSAKNSFSMLSSTQSIPHQIKPQDKASQNISQQFFEDLTSGFDQSKLNSLKKQNTLNLQPILEQQSAQFINSDIDIQDSKTLIELKQLLNTYQIGTHVGVAGNGVKKSSIYDSASKLYVKHSFSNIAGDLYFTQPTYLSHILISFNFQLLQQQQIYTIQPNNIFATNSNNISNINSSNSSNNNNNNNIQLFSADTSQQLIQQNPQSTIQQSITSSSSFSPKQLQQNIEITVPSTIINQKSNLKIVNTPILSLLPFSNSINYNSNTAELNNATNLQHHLDLDDPQRYIHNLNNKFSKNSFQLEESLIQNSQLKHLPLSLVSQKGASSSFQQQESLITCPNADSFVTNYANSSFTFRHLHEKRMIIDSITVHSIISSKSGAYPIGSGLIFIADNVSFFDMVDSFNGMNMAGYNQWQLQRKFIDSPLQQWEPVGCFEFNSNKEVIKVEMDIKRPGKYVHLLPTNFRSFPQDFTGYFQNGILDIQYFGVQGKTLDEDASYEDNSLIQEESKSQNYFTESTNSNRQNQEVPFLQFQQQQKAEQALNSQMQFEDLIESGTINIDIQLEKENSWHRLNPKDILILRRVKINNPLDDYPVSTLPNSLSLLNSTLEIKHNIHPSKTLELRISPRVFFDNKVTGIKVSLSENASNMIYSNYFLSKNPIDNYMQYTLNDYSVQCFQSKESGDSSFLSKDKQQEYRHMLLDPEKYENLNKIILKDVLLQTTKSQANCEELKHKRIQALKLLTKLMKAEGRFVQIFYSDLDLKTFIETIILEVGISKNGASSKYSSFSEDLKEAFEFLFQFRKVYTFSTDLEKVLINQITTNIFDIEKADKKNFEKRQQEQYKINHRGLKRFFCLLKWCSNILSQQIFDKLLKILHEVALQFKDQKNINYYLLRIEHDIIDFVFEKQLFTERFTSLNSASPQNIAQTKNVENPPLTQQNTFSINSTLPPSIISKKNSDTTNDKFKNFHHLLSSDMVIKEQSMETSSLQFTQMTASNLNPTEAPFSQIPSKLGKPSKEKDQKLAALKINDNLSEQMSYAIKEEELNINGISKQQQKYLLKSRIHVDVDGSTNKIYTIDLMKKHSIRDILLSFEKVTRSCAVRMKVQVYSINPNQHYENGFEKILIYSNDYQTCITNQLAVLSHYTEQQSLYFDVSTSNLNSLGFSYFEGIQTRYLVIQLTFALVPYASQHSDIEQANRIEVIPEIFGTPISDDLLSAHNINYFTQLFEGNRVEELKVIKPMKISPSLNQFKKVQISFTSFYLDSLGYYEQQIEQVTIQNSKKSQNLLNSSNQGTTLVPNMSNSIYFNPQPVINMNTSPKSTAKNNHSISSVKTINNNSMANPLNISSHQQHQQNMVISKSSQQSNEGKELEEKLKFVSNNFFSTYSSSISKKKKDNKSSSSSASNMDLSSKISNPSQQPQLSHFTTMQQPMLLSSSSQILHPNGGLMNSNVEDDFDDDDLLNMISQEKKEEQDKLEKDEVKEEIGEEEDQFESEESFEYDTQQDKKIELTNQLQDLQNELSVRLVKYHEKQKQLKQNFEGSNTTFVSNEDTNSFPSFKNISYYQTQLQAEKLKLKQDQQQIQQLCAEIRQIQLEILNLPQQQTPKKKRKTSSLNSQSEDPSLDYLASLAYELCSFLKSDERLAFRLIQKEQMNQSNNTINNTGLNSVKEEDINYQNSPKSSDERRFQEYNSADDDEEKKNQKEQADNINNEVPFLSQMCLDLFEIFVVYESGHLHNEVKSFLLEIVFKSINRADTNMILNKIVERYLISPYIQKNKGEPKLSSVHQFIPTEILLQQLREDIKNNLNPPLYSAIKIINQINLFNIIDVTSFFQKLKEKQQQAEQALDFRQKINEERMNGLTVQNSEQNIKQLQELLLYIWNITSILKNEYIKVQLRQYFSQQRNQQLIQQQQQLFEKQGSDEDFNTSESSQGLYICQNLIGFLLKNSYLISEKDLSSLLSHLFDLMLMIINCVPLSHISKISSLLFTPNQAESPGMMKSEENPFSTPLIYSLFFKALSLNYQPLLNSLEIFISNIIYPKQLENYSELTYCSAQPLVKTQLTEEMDKYLETQLNVLYHLQQMIDYILDYPKNTKGTNPYCFVIQPSNLSITLQPQTWIEHLKFTLQILQNSAKTVNKISSLLFNNNIIKLNKKIVLIHKKNQNPPSKKMSEKRKASISSRKNSLASRKNSSGVDFEQIPTSLIKSKTAPSYNNDFQSFNFLVYTNQMSLEEYIDIAIIDKQMLIQTHIALKLVELLNPNGAKPVHNKNKKEIDEVNEEEFEDDANEEEITNDESTFSQNYKFQNSVFVWSLVMSTLSLLKGQIIYESNIFINLVHLYLNSSEEVKQVHLKNIHNLTKIVLNSGFQTKELCNDLLKIILRLILKKPLQSKKDTTLSSLTLDQNDVSQSAAPFNKDFVEDQDLFLLINGWLEILLTKDTPAPEEFYQALQQQKEWKNCFCKLNARGAVHLFIGISKYITLYLNYGGVEGVHMADEKITSKLQVAEYLIKILLSAESSYQHLAIIEALSNWHLIESLKSSYSRCIVWYFFNKNADNVKSVSPASMLMKSISNQIQKLFALVVEKQNIAEICIELLFKHSIAFSKALHSNISQSSEQQQAHSLSSVSSNTNLYSQYSPILPYSNQIFNNEMNITASANLSITTYNAFSLATRQSKIFQELLNLWLINDQIAQFLVFKINGFSHLLDIIGLNSSGTTSQNIESHSLTNVTSLTEMNNSMPPLFTNDDSLLMNQGMFNYLSMISVGADRQALPSQTPSQFPNQISYNNPWNQYLSSSSQHIQKTPSSLQIGNAASGLNKNFPFTPSNANAIDKKSVILNESGQTLNSISSSHIISSQQFAQLASLLAKGTGTSYIEPTPGIFGTSEINENTKNSFLKYQINHSSYHNNINSNLSGQNSSQLQMSYQFQMNNSNNSNQSQMQLTQFKPSYFGLNTGLKNTQSGISQTFNTNNFQPPPPPNPPMLYPPQYILTNNSHQVQIQTSSSSSGNNTINFNAGQGFIQYNPYTNPMSEMNDSEIISLANNLQQDYQYIMQQKQKNSEMNFPLKTPINSPNQTQDPLSLLVETECCNQIQLIPLLGQNFQLSQGIQDWSYNKKGNKNKITMHLLNDGQHQELQVLLKLNKTVEMKKFKIGFNCQPPDYSDQSKIIGVPSSVIVEGGLSENKLIPLGSLQQINDDKYSSYGVKVFVKNFTRIKDETGTIEKCIKSLAAPKVSYIKLRIIRPVITSTEESLIFSNKQLSNIAVSINFLSIIGYINDNLSLNIPQYIFKIQTDSAVQIIGKLCAVGMGFDKTVELIANNKQLIQKVKQGFESLEQLIGSYEQQLSSFLICIALNNDEFADWIFEYLLDSSKNKTVLVKLLTEIISSQKMHTSSEQTASSNKALPRIEKLYEYIVKQIEFYLENNPTEREVEVDTDNGFSLSSIFPFVDALIAALRISYPHPKNNSSGEISKQVIKLRVNINVISSLISLYLKCVAQKAEGFSKLTIKLIVSLLYLPIPFYCEDQNNLIKQSMTLIWDRWFQKKQYNLTELIVALAHGGNQCSEWFLQDHNKYYKQLINVLLQEMASANGLEKSSNNLNQSPNINITNSNQHYKKIIHLMSILCIISKSPEIKKLVTSYNSSISSSNSNIVPAYIKIYSLMKNKKADSFFTSQTSSFSQPSSNLKLLYSWVDNEYLSLFVDFLKTISQNDKDVIDQVVQALNEDIKELDHKRDQLFVYNLLVPILQSTSTVPLCFHAFDTLQHKWLINPIKVLNHPYYQAKFLQSSRSKDKKKIDKFSTKLFSHEQKKVFLKTLKSFTHNTGLYKKIKSYDWVKEVSQDSDSDPSFMNQLENKILNNPPYIIVIEGMNKGEKSQAGVFCSQAIQKSSSDGIYNIPLGDDCFMFYYTDTYQIHFKIEGNEFGQFDTSPDTSSIIFKHKELDRIYLNFTEGGASFADFNLFDMKSVEHFSTVPHTIPNEFVLSKAEYWVLKPQNVEEKRYPLKMENMFEVQNTSHHLFSSQYYKSESSFNFYRSPAVYHFPENLSLREVIHKLSVPGLQVSQEVLEKLKFTLRQSAKVFSCEDDISIKDLQSLISKNSNDIIDLEYSVNQFFQQLPVTSSNNNASSLIQTETSKSNIISNLQKEQNIIDTFTEQKGFKNIIALIKEQLQNWNNKSRAKKWLTYVQELHQFTILPNFFCEFMKQKESVSNLFQFLAGVIDTEDGQQDNYPIAKAFKRSQYGQEKNKEEMEKNKQFEEQERKAVVNFYDVLSKVFSQDYPDNKIKNITLENNLLQTVFDKITSVSKEKPRKFIDHSLTPAVSTADKMKGGEQEEEPKQKVDTSILLQGVQKTSQGEKDEKSRQNEKKVKKGTGYASENTGQNQKWNTDEYVEINKSRSELIQSLMKVLQSFFNYATWEYPQKFIQLICESSLLPLLESAFRSGSLLEISKESQLMLSYLRIIEVMSENEGLFSCLIKIDSRYQPTQKESIFELLTILRKTAEIFLNCINPVSTPTIQDSQSSKLNEKSSILSSIPMYQFGDKQVEKSNNQEIVTQQSENNAFISQIATRIIQVHEKIERAKFLHDERQIEKQNKNAHFNDDRDIEDIEESKRVQQVLELPLNQKYRILLENFRFGYFSMMDHTKNNQYNHNYNQQISQNKNPSQVKMIRLAQEVADMSNSLPVDYTNSMFVRCDSKRVDVLKCIIMGSSGTPYANGAFLYDIFFDDTYPNSPPKVSIQTTGNGKVRFNPNLYSCGKGTWQGQASENWDPKISTLLQVLVSLQSIIMNEDIYFNEPGYEGLSGTEEGEKKNEGYSNVVRYCNIKYAMIDAIRNPPAGFEEVIKRHFYLKKNEILKECESWIDRSTKKQATYYDLVTDHNKAICQEFEKSKTKYSELLVVAYSELKQELEKLQPPTSVETPEEIALKKARKLEKINRRMQITSLVDQKENQHTHAKKVASMHNALDDEQEINNSPRLKQLPNQGEEIDIENEEVKDRWSRYICAMGIDAVAKQSKCNIFLSGLGPLGVEIAKNIALSGVKRITLHDTKIVRLNDLVGQFFLRKNHIGKNRADACIQDIQLLNHYVRVDKNTHEINTNTSDFLEKLQLQDYHVVILTDNYSNEILTAVNAFCRERQIKFIAAQVQGPFAYLFNDFGDSFEIVDKNGEDPHEVIISNIEEVIGKDSKKKLKVTLLPGVKHPYEDKDRILIREVKGMRDIVDETKSINDTTFEIETINTNSFYLLTNNNYTAYGGSGIAKNIKTPISLQFSSFKHCLQQQNTASFDPNMSTHDFEKLETIPYLHIAFISLSEFIQKYSRYPKPWSIEDSQLMQQIANIHFNNFDLPSKQEEKVQQRFTQYITQFSFTASGTFPPLCAFMGGYVSQEIIKAITNKYIPTKQYFYTDCVEVLPSVITWQDIQSSAKEIEKLQSLIRKEQEDQDENVQLTIVLGKDLCEKLQHSKVFMVGSGAIGCELLKNFAMISLCTGEEISERNLKRGQLTLTDPDHIETSNLNRQFLFREEHLRKPKSSTAAHAAIKMNHKLKDHIVACLDKVCVGTKNIFTDNFFEDQDIVANALDNVEARRYVDNRCVSAKTPLLESGTLGSKGHVQVIIPYKTESYGSAQDPQDDGGDIPHCTLKMFPEDTLHCVEWARDKFGKMVTYKPKVVQKLLDEIELIQKGSVIGEIKNLRKTLNVLKSRPISFEDCIEYAVQKFYKYFRNNIKQLLHTYPLDHKNKDGSDFWKLPKRAPKEIEKLDSANPLHLDFITGVAVMKAKIFNIPYPQNFRQQTDKKSIMAIAINFKVPDFSPSDEKSNQIEEEVNSSQNEKETIASQIEEEIQYSSGNMNQQTTTSDDENAGYLIQQILNYKTKLDQPSLVKSEEFEKDNDSNGHIDFIYSTANLRSVNYQLAPMDWLTVKLKAGKIVPALATTTAAVAGLQTIELVKTIKNVEISKMKNAFLNLAVPSLQLTEPAGAPIFTITKELKVSIWDRWETGLQKSDLIQSIFKYFEEEKKLKIVNILIGTELIYASTMKEDHKQSILETTFAEIINNNQDEIESDASYLDLNVLFTEINNTQILSNTPTVRVLFKSTSNQQQI